MDYKWFSICFWNNYKKKNQSLQLNFFPLETCKYP